MNSDLTVAALDMHPFFCYYCNQGVVSRPPPLIYILPCFAPLRWGLHIIWDIPGTVLMVCVMIALNLFNVSFFQAFLSLFDARFFNYFYSLDSLKIKLVMVPVAVVGVIALLFVLSCGNNFSISVLSVLFGTVHALSFAYLFAIIWAKVGESIIAVFFVLGVGLFLSAGSSGNTSREETRESIPNTVVNTDDGYDHIYIEGKSDINGNPYLYGRNENGEFVELRDWNQDLYKGSNGKLYRKK